MGGMGRNPGLWRQGRSSSLRCGGSTLTPPWPRPECFHESAAQGCASPDNFRKVKGTHIMNIERIGIRLGANPIRAVGDVALNDNYVTRWWLPVLGPSATWYLQYFARNEANYRTGWRFQTPAELAEPLGLSAGTGVNSPVLRTLDRLIRFRHARWIVAPRTSQDNDPLLTIFDTLSLVPHTITLRWSTGMQAEHSADLARMAKQTAWRQ